MTVHNIFFAGGGTGGHIYPALAIAQQIKKIQPDANIMFFCSDRAIDSQILAKTGFNYIPLPAVGFSANPIQVLKFLIATHKSYYLAKKVLAAHTSAVVVGVGGFVSTGPILAAHTLDVPVKMVNTDSVPGKANKFLARYADEIYVQFELSRNYFGKAARRVVITGCPLRADFATPDKNKAITELGLDSTKKILLITGASTGARSINNAICALLDKLSAFANDWQIVHLTGRADFETVKDSYKDCTVMHTVVDYYDDMANLLAAADLVIGRAGAVSVAEYAAAGVPSICLPYPYHKDNHQRINAEQLEKAGCAVIVDDKIDAQANAQQLWPHLEMLVQERANDQSLLQEMRHKATTFGISTAAAAIAKKILS
ncbi:MAG: UDP-N-acetylglucosamine--N-acetylmuramyl-(pentapeptide) pyrophosphoryl-undecaprenol N-acetylglucosamine transferase [Sedimentisphaerales bacterium]|nr:UDP-N-acetylglucosamine--N-acetylmuramyl-(pentapeptide) pyrophosphoryl-undecaprenol N-acetylglucosamine transferase [Sedimentisphaerales bacterium]